MRSNYLCIFIYILYYSKHVPSYCMHSICTSLIHMFLCVWGSKNFGTFLLADSFQVVGLIPYLSNEYQISGNKWFLFAKLLSYMETFLPASELRLTLPVPLLLCSRFSAWASDFWAALAMGWGKRSCSCLKARERKIIKYLVASITYLMRIVLIDQIRNIRVLNSVVLNFFTFYLWLQEGLLGTSLSKNAIVHFQEERWVRRPLNTLKFPNVSQLQNHLG